MFFCTACEEVVEAQEPCSCVFNAVGTIDAQGVLHTAKRLELTDWWDGGDAGEFTYRRINRVDPSYEPVYSREQAARQDPEVYRAFPLL